MSFVGGLCLINQTLPVTRTAVGTYVNGVYVPGAESTFNITVNVQPATPEELLNLQANQRVRSAIRLWTDDDIRTADESPNTLADKILYQGREYQVQQVNRWFDPCLGHNEFLAVEFEGQ